MERGPLETPPSAYRGGAGEPMLLLHGGAATCRQWRPVVPLLEPHHEVLAVNLMGHWGGPPPPPGVEASIDVFADAVERDMDAAGWCPVQLVFPERDLVFPRSRYGARLIDAVPGAEVHDLPGAGHGATWDDPEQVARVILQLTTRHARQ